MFAGPFQDSSPRKKHERSSALVNLNNEVFAILHNLIVRMSLDGVLEETAVTELYEQLNGNEGEDQSRSHVKTTAEMDGDTLLNVLFSRVSFVSNRKRQIELTEKLSHHLWKRQGNGNYATGVTSSD